MDLRGTGRSPVTPERSGGVNRAEQARQTRHDAPACISLKHVALCASQSWSMERGSLSDRDGQKSRAEGRGGLSGPRPGGALRSRPKERSDEGKDEPRAKPRGRQPPVQPIEPGRLSITLHIGWTRTSWFRHPRATKERRVLIGTESFPSTKWALRPSGGGPALSAPADRTKVDTRKSI